MIRNRSDWWLCIKNGFKIQKQIRFFSLSWFCVGEQLMGALCLIPIEHMWLLNEITAFVFVHKAHFICNKSWESFKHKKTSFRLRERRWPFACVHCLQYPIRYVSLCILMMHSLQWFAAYSQSRTFMYLKCHWFPKIETQTKMSANSVQNQSLNQTIQIQMRYTIMTSAVLDLYNMVWIVVNTVRRICSKLFRNDWNIHLLEREKNNNFNQSITSKNDFLLECYVHRLKLICFTSFHSEKSSKEDQQK